MSGCKGGVEVVVGSRRDGAGKVDSSNTKDPVPKARNLLASFEKDREEQEESELIITGRQGSYQAGLTVSQYRRQWESRFSGMFGSFVDTTIIPPKRFTEKAPQLGAFPLSTLQFFSVKLCETRGDLKLPVDVFGMVAARDSIDHNRNIIFHRSREDCQTLSQEDPYLVLAGPTRAVMVALSDPVIIEVELSVKGTTESEDKYLSFLVAPVFCGNKLYSCLHKYSYTSKLSTLEFKLGHIVCSVEATISISLIDGSWPSSYRGIFTAFAVGCRPGLPGNVDDEKIVLFDSGGKKLPVTSDGGINLSRRVVSVQIGGKLQVYVDVMARGKNVKRKMRDFKSSEDGESNDIFNMGFCKMQVTVNWSLISYYSAPREAGGK
ncbi:hypothetical protein PR202_ga28994 [Eleusine coracana subsp. coracana]|uniref:DUF6598 domain-containing protein n=1 Tax=Eleusine coracana subsp. coracana TaxID=191504 RepID=A0AAV5DIS0_ELECO|nr:hypothetical protein QOZ80_7AG0579330 [Eleusine coracana subsp. coracana]GJN10858.1 hypothetical protein PR202_ga28994 [Eleusine coracana subsp. coracana]